MHGPIICSAGMMGATECRSVPGSLGRVQDACIDTVVQHNVRREHHIHVRSAECTKASDASEQRVLRSSIWGYHLPVTATTAHYYTTCSSRINGACESGLLAIGIACIRSTAGSDEGGVLGILGVRHWWRRSYLATRAYFRHQTRTASHARSYVSAIVVYVAGMRVGPIPGTFQFRIARCGYVRLSSVFHVHRTSEPLQVTFGPVQPCAASDRLAEVTKSQSVLRLK